MASAETTALDVESREITNSRAVRRLRRDGMVPGVVYGGTGGPVPIQVDARTLRLALAHSGAVIEVKVDGEKGTPVVVKDQQRDPVKGTIIHVDLLRVRLDQAIQSTVPLELTGAEDAPGSKEGGVLEHITRELNIEALPTEIPDVITHDVSEMEINDTVVLSAVSVPPGVTLLDDLEETVVATLTPPRLQIEEEEEIEEETEMVGEEGEEAEAPEGEGATGEEAEQQQSDEG